MTKEEAIKILPDMKGAGSEWDEAIDVAVDALKAQLPSAQQKQDREFIRLKLSIDLDGRGYISVIYMEFDDNGVGHECEGYSSYSLDVISDYLKRYFMPSAQSERPKGEWIPCSERLPDEGHWVLGTVRNVHDGTVAPKEDIVQIIMGITEAERSILKQDSNPRGNIITQADQWRNNKVPYCWETWGTGKYFGQQVIAWMPLPESYKGGEQ